MVVDSLVQTISNSLECPIIYVETKVETASTEYQFDRIIYLFLTLERIAKLDLIQTCILHQYEYTYSIQTDPMYLLPLILIKGVKM